MSNWIHATLQDICLNEKGSIISGPFGSNISSKFFVDAGVPVIRGNNLSLSLDKFFDDGFVFLTQEKADELNCYAVEGDLLFTAAGTIGQVGILEAPLKYEKYVISNKQLRARIDTNKVDLLYAYYWFSSAWMQDYFIRNNKGSTVPLISLSELKDAPISYPEGISEQRRIVAVIETLSRKIETNRSICSELESMAKTIYDYWFTQFDFPDADGKPYRSSGGEMEWNELLKRKIPRGWGVTTIGVVTRNYDSKRIPLSQNERDSMKGDIPYYGATGIMDYVNRHIFDGHYVLIAEDGSVMDEKGNPIVQMIWGKTWVNNHAHVLEGCNGYSNELLYLLLHRIPVVKIMTGSIQKKINQDNLNSYRIPHTPSFIARAFSETVAPMFEEIRVLQQENDELTKLRDWLLPMLMNGQATVADAEEEVIKVIPFAPQTVEVRQAARNFGDKKTDDTADLVKAFMRRKKNDSKA